MQRCDQHASIRAIGAVFTTNMYFLSFFPLTCLSSNVSIVRTAFHQALEGSSIRAVAFPALRLFARRLCSFVARHSHLWDHEVAHALQRQTMNKNQQGMAVISVSVVTDTYSGRYYTPISAVARPATHPSQTRCSGNTLKHLETLGGTDSGKYREVPCLVHVTANAVISGTQLPSPEKKEYCEEFGCV